jgi:hypothetical protein
MTTAKKQKLTAVKEQEVKEVTKQEAQVPATQTFNPADWGVQSLTARDIVIPKVLPMQAMSKKVTDGQAMLGEFRDSLTGDLVGMSEGFGKPAKPIEFIPFYMEKVWIVFEAKDGNPKNLKFAKTIAIDAQNENYPYEEVLNGVLIKRDRTMNFYCLNPADPKSIPFILSFRRTSVKAGQKIATTMFMKNINAGKTPASMVMELTGTKTSNDKGTFVVMDVREKRPSTDAEVASAFNWVKTVRAGAAKVDNSDLQAEAETTAYNAVDTDSSEY